MTLATIAYGTAALGFLALNLLLIISRGGDPFGYRLALASALSALWAGSAAFAAFTSFTSAASVVDALEVARDAGWLFLLTGVFAQRLPRWLVIFVQVACLSLLVVQVLHWSYPSVQMARGGLALAFLGLVVIEQVYRNAIGSEQGWLKYLLLGVGGQFAYDLFLYAQSELLGAIGPSAWSVRGVAVVLAIPLIVLAVRNSVASGASIFISRHVVFYSTALAAVGTYLCAMAAGGYYVRFVGGTWGGALQLLFLLGAAGVLLSLLWSTMLRRQLRVFISKHFYRNKYDYRVEWLRFVHMLSSAAPENVQLGALQALTRVFSSPRAVLFVADETGSQFRAIACWSESGEEIALPADVSGSADWVQFMKHRGWIIDVDEYRRAPGIYEHIELPAWLGEDAMSIVAPIMQGTVLAGFVVLARPPPPFELAYEDRDLLMTMGRHVATHLAQQEANRKLAENRQFETYSRLTAFMMHDLKNSVAQLRLVVSNAVKFRHQPEFVDDAMATIDNAAQRITRLLDQLRLGAAAATRRPLKLQGLIDTALARCAAGTPAPLMTSAAPRDVIVEADQEHLTSVIEHVVRNAQDATPSDGTVSIDVTQTGSYVTILVADSGAGMNPDFVRDRLFRPFDTTKGAAGMGIGAHQAREYVRSLGGHVNVQSSPGRGTRFAITLPALIEQG